MDYSKLDWQDNEAVVKAAAADAELRPPLNEDDCWAVFLPADRTEYGANSSAGTWDVARELSPTVQAFERSTPGSPLCVAPEPATRPEQTSKERVLKVHPGAYRFAESAGNSIWHSEVDFNAWMLAPFFVASSDAEGNLGSDWDDAASRLPASPAPAPEVLCVGCEGKPVFPNLPCTLCGKSSAPADEPGRISDDKLRSWAKTYVQDNYAPTVVNACDLRDAAVELQELRAAAVEVAEELGRTTDKQEDVIPSSVLRGYALFNIGNIQPWVSEVGVMARELLTARAELAAIPARQADYEKNVTDSAFALGIGFATDGGWANVRAENAEAELAEERAKVERLQGELREVETRFGLPHDDDPLLEPQLNCGTFKPREDHAGSRTVLEHERHLRKQAEARSEAAEFALQALQGAKGENNAAREDGGWISVEEHKPEVGARVLAWNENGSMYAAKYVPDCTCEYKWHDNDRQTPKKWRPLPAPPQAERKEAQ